MSLNEERLTHLKQLEAESIHIIREVAAEFENPVMLYSIGKDSAVMLTSGAQSVLSCQASISTSTCRYGLEI
jgi:3'-phosphoadenosine 5'-phosphosulfate sulfotransferase (PAPS reductase)/FAD synthetase